jgi:hypothetical protein
LAADFVAAFVPDAAADFAVELRAAGVFAPAVLLAAALPVAAFSDAGLRARVALAGACASAATVVGVSAPSCVGVPGVFSPFELVVTKNLRWW